MSAEQGVSKEELQKVIKEAFTLEDLVSQHKFTALKTIIQSFCITK